MPRRGDSESHQPFSCCFPTSGHPIPPATATQFCQRPRTHENLQPLLFLEMWGWRCAGEGPGTCGEAHSGCWERFSPSQACGWEALLWAGPGGWPGRETHSPSKFQLGRTTPAVFAGAVPGDLAWGQGRGWSWWPRARAHPKGETPSSSPPSV